MLRSCCAAVAVGCLVLVASGQEVSPNALRHSKAVSPLITKSTVLIVHVDLTRLDLKGATDYAFDLMELPERERARAQEDMKFGEERLKGAIAAGATDVYVSMGTDFDPITGPDVVVATKKGQAGKVADYLKQIAPGPGEVTFVVAGDAVCLGMSERVKSYEANSGRTSNALSRIFHDAGDATGHAVLVLSDQTRNLVAENAPPLPPELTEASAGDLANSLKYAVLAADLPPKLKLKLTLQATDADAAKSLGETINNGLKLVSDLPIPDRELAELKKTLPIDKLTKMLTPKVQGEQVVISIGEKPEDVKTLENIIGEAAKQARDAAEKLRYVNNFKQIGLALHNYHDVFTKFPGTANLDKAGKPLLSWRVHILPFIEQSALHGEFHLNEPWDSEHNKKLIEKMPEIYADARVKGLKPGMTNIVAPVFAKGIWSTKEGASLRTVTDGTSNTILATQCDGEHAVIWTKPDDLKIDGKEPLTGIFMVDKKFIVLLADGSVHTLPDSIDADKFKALLTASGGEAVDVNE